MLIITKVCRVSSIKDILIEKYSQRQISLEAFHHARSSNTKERREIFIATRINKQIGFVHREMTNTSSYEPRFHGQTNKTSDRVADYAVWNVGQEQKTRTL